MSSKSSSAESTKISTPSETPNSTGTTTNSVPGAFGLMIGVPGVMGPKRSVAQKVEDAEKKFEQLFEQLTVRIKTLEQQVGGMIPKNPNPPPQPVYLQPLTFVSLNPTLEKFKTQIVGTWHLMSCKDTWPFIERRHACGHSEGPIRDRCFAESGMAIKLNGDFLQIDYTIHGPTASYSTIFSKPYTLQDFSVVRPSFYTTEENGVTWETSTFLQNGEEVSRTRWELTEHGAKLRVHVRRFGMECWKKFVRVVPASTT